MWQKIILGIAIDIGISIFTKDKKTKIVHA